jgi:phage baseplate assembly protein W
VTAVYTDINTDWNTRVGPVLLTDLQAVENKLLNLFRCPRGSRLHHPDFGCNLPALLHEPCDDTTAREIYIELFESLQKWMPEVQLNMGSSFVIPLESRDGFYVSLSYEIPKLQTAGSLAFNALRS